MGTAAMVWSITSETSWIGVGPDPEGSVSATYTGRSTAYQVDRPASPADCAAAATWNHCTRSTTWIGDPTTNSAARGSRLGGRVGVGFRRHRPPIPFS